MAVRYAAKRNQMMEVRGMDSGNRAGAHRITWQQLCYCRRGCCHLFLPFLTVTAWFSSCLCISALASLHRGHQNFGKCEGGQIAATVQERLMAPGIWSGCAIPGTVAAIHSIPSCDCQSYPAFKYWQDVLNICRICKQHAHLVFKSFT